MNYEFNELLNVKSDIMSLGMIAKNHTKALKKLNAKYFLLGFVIGTGFAFVASKHDELKREVEDCRRDISNLKYEVERLKKE